MAVLTDPMTANTATDMPITRFLQLRPFLRQFVSFARLSTKSARRADYTFRTLRSRCVTMLWLTRQGVRSMANSRAAGRSRLLTATRDSDDYAVARCAEPGGVAAAHADVIPAAG